jgi:hypothetical protein
LFLGFFLLMVYDGHGKVAATRTSKPMWEQAFTYEGTAGYWQDGRTFNGLLVPIKRNKNTMLNFIPLSVQSTDSP